MDMMIPKIVPCILFFGIDLSFPARVLFAPPANKKRAIARGQPHALLTTLYLPRQMALLGICAVVASRYTH